jgi:hypothetical protein
VCRAVVLLLSLVRNKQTTAARMTRGYSRKTPSTTTRSDYPPKDPQSPTLSHAPPRVSVYNQPFTSNSTYRELFPEGGYPDHVGKQGGSPNRPPVAAPQYATKLSSQTTSRMSFQPPKYGAAVSYAPVKSFVPNKAAVGQSTNREFHVVFKAPVISGFKPTFVQPKFATKLSTNTTTRNDFAPPGLTGLPSRSYAPKRTYKPNLAPLGESTTRAEYKR